MVDIETAAERVRKEVGSAISSTMGGVGQHSTYTDKRGSPGCHRCSCQSAKNNLTCWKMHSCRWINFTTNRRVRYDYVADLGDAPGNRVVDDGHIADVSIDPMECTMCGGPQVDV